MINADISGRPALPQRFRRSKPNGNEIGQTHEGPPAQGGRSFRAAVGELGAAQGGGSVRAENESWIFIWMFLGASQGHGLPFATVILSKMSSIDIHQRKCFKSKYVSFEEEEKNIVVQH